MIVLYSTQPDIIQYIQKGFENAYITDDILSCQIQLSQEDFECDLLMVEIDTMINPSSFIQWIIDTDIFIKKVVLYCVQESNIEKFSPLSIKLNHASYKTYIISKAKLLEGFKHA